MALREIEPHPQDVHRLIILRKDLIGWRHIRRLSQDQLGVISGITGDAVGSLEAGQTQSLMSQWQGVAKGLSLKLRWIVAQLPKPAVTDEIAMLQAMYEKNPQMASWERLMLMCQLRQLRIDLGVASATVAEAMNIKPGSLTDWEISCTDPAISRVMTYARVLGGKLWISLDELD